jgi:MFS family permease
MAGQRTANVLRHRDFRLLFIGQSASQVGAGEMFLLDAATFLFGAMLLLPVKPRALPQAVLVVVAFISGLAGALTGVWWETTLARHIPPGSLSRVSAWDYMGSLALMPLGFAVVGPLADAFGVRWVLGVGSVLGALIAALALTPKSVRALTAAPLEPLETLALQPSSSRAMSA